jgi:flap endonuclease-1
MGVNLKDIILHEPLNFEDLKGKTIAIDALNSLYQFLASIRQPDGTPLMDSKNRVTSHLSGLLYRTVRLIQLGIKPIYVFDGEPPKLKEREILERRESKENAHIEWKKAISEERLEDAKKFARRTSKLTDEMLDDSKRLLEFMGVPYVQAPSEGEAQCVELCKKNDSWAVGSQDYDALLLGAPRLVKGLTLSGTFELTIVHLEKVLNELGITREQLIEIAILVGTDFNDGIKGIGPKKALKIVRENRLSEIQFDFDFNEVRNIFMNPVVTDDYSLEWKNPDISAMVEFLSKEHDFSEERVRKAGENLAVAFKEFSQKGLGEWL